MDTFLKAENKSQWTSLLDSALFKTFFHSLDWEEFLERELRWIKFERYVWRDEALFSVARCRLFGREKIISHPLCEYGGPLPLKQEFDFENFLEDFRSTFGFKARIKFHPYLTERGLTPFKSGSNPVQFRSTFWIENFSRKSKEDLWRNFRKTLRHEIKKAENSGIEVFECAGEADLKKFYSLYLQTVKRHKNIPLSFSAFKFFNHKDEGAKVFLAKKHDGSVAGGSVFLFYPPFIHYFINASDIELREYSPNHLILWKVIQKYIGSGFDYLDLGGTRKGSDLGIFKRGWSARELPIYEVGVSDKNFKGDTSILRNVWAMLPASIMRRLSPLMLWMKV